MESMEFGQVIRQARKAIGMTQADLGEAMDRTRYWVIQLEKGERYDGNDPAIGPSAIVRLATVLNLDAQKLLAAAGVPPEKWPNLSYSRSNNGSVSTVDIDGLSESQATLVQQLVNEFKAGNYAQQTSREQPE